MNETQFIFLRGPEIPPGEPEKHAFYDAIGRFVLVWGRFEQHLENLERMALNIAARSAPQRRMEKSLSATLKRLCDVFATCTELSAHAARMNTLARLTKDLGGFRHKLIHSNFSGFEAGPPEKLVLCFVSHDKEDKMKVENFKPALADIELMIDQTLSLHGELLMPLLEDIQVYQSYSKSRRKRDLHL